MNKLWLMRVTKGEGEYKYTDEILIYIYHVQESSGRLDIETICYSVRGTVIEL